MRDIINSLDIRGEMKPNKLFNIIKTKSSKTNELIYSKIILFKNIDDFFSCYSDKKANDLLYILDKLNNINLNDKENCFKSSLIIEKYISDLVHVILSVKVISKTQKILEKILISSKKNLNKLKIENQIENHNQKKLLSLIDKILNKSKTKKPKNFSKVPMLQKQFSSEEDFHGSIFSRLSFQKMDTENSEDVIYTPKFILEKKDTIENIFCIYQNEQTSSNLINPLRNKESVLTFSKLILEEEPKRNIYSEKQKEIIQNEKKITDVFSFELENVNEKKSSLSARELSKINKFKNLLEMIINLYKKGIINAEEKIKLKQMVIKKPEMLEKFYFNKYKNMGINNNILSIEIEKIIKINENI